jgi:hypothetical protein
MGASISLLQDLSGRNWHVTLLNMSTTPVAPPCPVSLTAPHNKASLKREKITLAFATIVPPAVRKADLQ